MVVNQRSVFIWIFAVIVTAASAYYQRATGPSYPTKGNVVIDNTSIPFKLERSHVSGNDYTISIPVEKNSISGTVTWRRYNSDDEWQQLLMKRENGNLTAVIPSQPPAGKVEYMVALQTEKSSVLLQPEPVVMRFRGDVPAFILIPHIICMFLMFLFSNRAGMEYFNQTPTYKIHTYLAIAFIVLGGLILGPITQKYAFGAYWTGIPFGHDLTDNKTLIAFLAWLPAFIKVLRGKEAGKWVLAAAIITLFVFLIPHSVLGSELNYRKP